MNEAGKITVSHRRRSAAIYLLPGLSDISTVQTGYASLPLIAEMSGISESPGSCGVVAGLIPTETGHTRRNQSPAFSSLPIFDVSCSGP